MYKIINIFFIFKDTIPTYTQKNTQHAKQSSKTTDYILGKIPIIKANIFTIYFNFSPLGT